jgi:hypothetical protein
LRELDDRTLTDIGLDRGMLRDVADDMSRVAVNDNELPVALSHLAANDNIDSVRAG